MTDYTDARCAQFMRETGGKSPWTGDKPLPSMISFAKSVCAGCPLRDPCYIDGLREGDYYTIRGGVNMRRVNEIVGRYIELDPGIIELGTARGSNVADRARSALKQLMKETAHDSATASQ